MVEPFVWQMVGWCRVEVDLAGRQRGKGEGEGERGQLRTLLPVGSRELGLELVTGSCRTGRASWRRRRAACSEEPPPLPQARLGPNGHVRRDDERAVRRISCWVPLRRHRACGASRPDPAAAPPGERPRRHGRQSGACDAARPGRSRGDGGARRARRAGARGETGGVKASLSNPLLLILDRVMEQLRVGNQSYGFHKLDAAATRLPYTLRILLENVLRNGGEEAVEAVSSWVADAEPSREISFHPARVLLQDFTGVPGRRRPRRDARRDARPGRRREAPSTH